MNTDEIFTLRLPSGEQAKVSRFGGQVLSWTDAAGAECLYLSPWPTGPERPIRGGVPVCFPQFASRGPLMKHGFARTSTWNLVEKLGDAAARLELTDDHHTRHVWPHRFRLGLVVRLQPASLKLELQVTNTDSERWQFTGALHSYLRVPDVSSVILEGLSALDYEDALRGGALVRAEHRAPDLRQPVDRVYRNVPGSLTLRHAGLARFEIVQEGFQDVVVWNPGREGAAKLEDMPAEDASCMLCVEAGRIAQPVTLAPGDTWTGSQTLTKL